MSIVEQELILFFKLYILRHKLNYINYMEDTHILARWFDWTNAALIDHRQDAYIVCSSCLTNLGSCVGGTITFSCPHCQQPGNMAYEIQQICNITKINWYLCIYLFCKAVEDIYGCNNQLALQNAQH